MDAEDYKNIIRPKIDKTKFIISATGKAICFKDVKSLEFKSGFVYIHSQKKRMPLYTRTSTGTFRRFKTKNLDDLSLDHDSAIAINPVAKDVDAYFDDFKKYLFGKKFKSSSAITSQYIKSNPASVASYDKGKLLTLFEEVYKHIEFTIMDKRENSSKGKKE